MTPRQTERMDQETMRQLNRSLAKKTGSAELPRLIGTKQVCLILGIGARALMLRVQKGTFPPPLKGRQPEHGQTYAQWQRERNKWPTSLVRLAAVGHWGNGTPRTPEGWLALIEGWRS